MDEQALTIRIDDALREFTARELVAGAEVVDFLLDLREEDDGAGHCPLPPKDGPSQHGPEGLQGYGHAGPERGERSGQAQDGDQRGKDRNEGSISRFEHCGPITRRQLAQPSELSGPFWRS